MKDLRAILHLNDQPFTSMQSRSSPVEQLPAAQWGYPGLRRYLLHTDADLSIPVVVAQFPAARTGVVAGFNEMGKTRLCYQNGGLFGLCSHVFSADLRGFDELEPLPTDYDLYSWCGIDRALSDLVQLCGETVLGQQTGDALRVLAWIDKMPVSGAGCPVVYGRGEAALPALFAGLLSPRVKKIVLDSFLCSFESLATTPAPLWKRYAYLPGILPVADLPDLIKQRTGKKFLLINPLDAMKQRLSQDAANCLYGTTRSHTRVLVDDRIANPPGERPGWNFGDSHAVSYLKLAIQEWLEVQD